MNNLLRNFRFLKIFREELQKHRILPDSRISIAKTAALSPNVLTVCSGSGKIQIDRDCQIMDRCFIFAAETEIKIGKDVLIGPHTVIDNAFHNNERLDIAIKYQGGYGQPITIEEGVWIGTHCTILGGVRIGAHSIIGAHSLVMRDIPPYSIAVGVPCKIVGNRSSKTSK